MRTAAAKLTSVGVSERSRSPGRDNVVYQDQNGNFYGIPTFRATTSPGTAAYVSAPFSGMLVAHAAPTGAGPSGLDTAVTDGATSSGDPGQVTVPILTSPAHAAVPIVRIGHVGASVIDNLDLQDNGGNPPSRRARSRSRSIWPARCTTCRPETRSSYRSRPRPTPTHPIAGARS